jgi:hypothetical protein
MAVNKDSKNKDSSSSEGQDRNTETMAKAHPASEKSFLAKISDAKQAPPLAAFAAFPLEVNFEGQDKDEEIVLFVRKHPAVFIPTVFTILAMLLAPVLVLLVVGYTGANLPPLGFDLGILILWIMLIGTFIIVTFFKWFFNVNIITTERIVDIDFDKIFYHNVAETQLERVEDVSHRPVGVWASFFDFGTVYVQTAGEQREFEFKDVPRPRDIQDTILDLLELKQRRN